MKEQNWKWNFKCHEFFSLLKLFFTFCAKSNDRCFRSACAHLIHLRGFTLQSDGLCFTGFTFSQRDLWYLNLLTGSFILFILFTISFSLCFTNVFPFELIFCKHCVGKLLFEQIKPLLFFTLKEKRNDCRLWEKKIWFEHF